ncbi:MAG TPA: non-canonical purine NTP pyrophosphatase [Gaiellaceae bacterium]|nr:non-canonical purine NTP pyrophosphatase [Gaiellaceae bacterium]
MTRATFCSRNAHKARELEQLLPGWSIEPLDRSDWPGESGDTYYENALAKARFGREVGDPNRWMVGEDSGLEVEALGGGPGLHSARYAPEGPPAIARLLRELEDVSLRRARYVSELVALSPSGAEVRGTGTLEGHIAEEPRGSEGFGYDPVFVPDGESQTVAELGDAWKLRNSHRARAARALLAALGAALALVAAGCGSNGRVEHRVLVAFFARSAQARALAPLFPDKPGTVSCVLHSGGPSSGETLQATCSTDVSLVKPDRAVVTLTEAWNHGAQAHTWFFFIRRNGEVASVVQEGAAAPQAQHQTS